MYSQIIFTVEGVHVTYQLRRVQLPLSREEAAPEELGAALGQCQTTEQLLHFFFTTDFYVDEGFIRLFEKRLQELESPF